MRYFLPRFKIAVIEGKQDRLRSKIGGVPWGMPPEHWPTCCGRPQKLLAQLCHEPPMLDLGEEGAVLHLFHCLECLGIGNETGRAAFILNRSQMTSGLVTVPDYDYRPQLGEQLIGEFWIDGWEERDDGIPARRLRDFFKWETWHALTEEFAALDWFDGREATRFGGSPRWTGNGPTSLYAPPFQFLLQLNNGLRFEGPLPTADGAGCRIFHSTTGGGRITSRAVEPPGPGKARTNAPWALTHTRGDNHFWADFTNLGTDGTLFVFTNRERIPYEVRWYWIR